MTKLILKCLVVTLAGILVACAPTKNESIYQNATIDALLDGNYDGETSIAKLKTKGDFGLGTFEKLDGELLALSGTYYKMKSDGKVVVIDGDTKTPFAAVTFFDPTSKLKLTPATYSELQKQIDAARTSQGRAFAIQVHGTFSSVKVRSVPAQSPPYRRLVDVVKEQSVFEFKNVTGTLVGFWFPESMRHVNVPGYHFHFITTDKSTGGHVLDLKLESGTAMLQQIETIEIELENTPPKIFEDVNKSDDLHKVEK